MKTSIYIEYKKYKQIKFTIKFKITNNYLARLD